MPLLHMAANAEPQAQTSQSLRWISCAPTPRFLSRLSLALAAAALVLGVLWPARPSRLGLPATEVNPVIRMRWRRKVSGAGMLFG